MVTTLVANSLLVHRFARVVFCLQSSDVVLRLDFRVFEEMKKEILFSWLNNRVEVCNQGRFSG